MHSAACCTVLHHLPDLVAVLAADGTIRAHNPAAETLLGYRPGALVGRPVAAVVHSEDVPRVRRFLAEVRRTPGAVAAVAVRLRHQDGSWRQVEWRATNLLHDPHVGGIVAVARDITARTRREAQLTRRAFTDALTGLPNRARFRDRLTHALAALPRRPSGLAVLFLDLDDFKAVNDRFGHGAGDRLLTVVGRRLAACVRPGDTLARLGGDEFVVLLDAVAQPPDAIAVVERLLAAVRRPVRIAGHAVAVTASVGIALATPAAVPAGPGQLLRAADSALYQAKAAGKARAVVVPP